MKKKTQLFLVLAGLVILLAACNGAEVGVFDDQISQINAAQAWIDEPLDGSTVSILNGVQITAHGYVENGLGKFKVKIDDGDWYVPLKYQTSTISYGQMQHVWPAATGGWHTIHVGVTDLGGEFLASTQVDVFIEEEEELVLETLETPPTPTPEPFDRCDLFDPTTTTLTLHDVPLFTTDLTFYLTFDHPVWGLEELVEGDTDEYIFTALIGGYPTEVCTYRDYPSRLYCQKKDFPASWWGTWQSLEVSVNGCNEYIYVQDRVSFIKQACETSMDEDACTWTGGRYQCERTVCNCVCP